MTRVYRGTHEMYVQPKLHTSRKSKRLVSNKVNVGVELELLYIPNNFIDEGSSEFYPDSGLIESCDDGSLGAFGTEIKFKKPLNGLSIITALRHIKKAISDDDDVYASQLAGVHVHIDVSGMTIKQLHRFILLYSLLETPLFNVMGKERASNPFCTSSERSLRMRELISEFISSNKIGDIRSPRYCSLNLRSIEKFGSLEFRGHECTFDMSRVLDWINILLCIRRASLRYRYNLDKMVDMKASDASKIVKSIFTQELVGKYFSYEGLEDDFKRGLNFVQDVYMYDDLVDATNTVIDTFNNLLVSVADQVDEEESDSTEHEPWDFTSDNPRYDMGSVRAEFSLPSTTSNSSSNDEVIRTIISNRLSRDNQSIDNVRRGVEAREDNVLSQELLLERIREYQGVYRGSRGGFIDDGNDVQQSYNEWLEEWSDDSSTEECF